MATRRVVTTLLLALVAAGCVPRSSGAPESTATPSTSVAVATPSPSASTPDIALPSAIPLPVSGTSRLRIGLDRDPSSLDPAVVRDQAGLQVVDAVFDSLTRMAPDLSEVEPAAATSWESSRGGRVWTFRLREATWHDGLPVTATQFVRAFSHVATDAEGVDAVNAHLLSQVEGWQASQDDGVPLAGVTAPDARTLRITLVTPFADLPALVSHPALAPRRRGPLRSQRPVGNGPFQMDDDWAHNQFIRVTAVADHAAAPTVGEVVFLIYAGSGAATLQLEDFRAGALDVALVPPLATEEVRAEFGSSVDGHRGPGLLDGDTDEAYWIGFNTAQAPFDDPQVRLGISQLLDRDTIIEVDAAGTRSRATGIVPGGLPGAGSIDCAPCRHDPQSADMLLDGFADLVDGPVRVLTIEGGTNEAIAQSLATSIQEVTGVEAIVEAPPPGEWLARVRGPSLQVFRTGWTASWPTMGGVLEPTFHSSERGAGNLTRLDDAEVDEAIDDAMATASPGDVAAWQAVEQLVADRAVVAPVFTYRLGIVVADQVQGFWMDPSGRVDLAAVSVDEG